LLAELYIEFDEYREDNLGCRSGICQVSDPGRQCWECRLKQANPNPNRNMPGTINPAATFRLSKNSTAITLTSNTTAPLADANHPITLSTFFCLFAAILVAIIIVTIPLCGAIPQFQITIYFIRMV
jgi:hypothetical protein